MSTQNNETLDTSQDEPKRSGLVTKLADHYGMDARQFYNTIIQTVMPKASTPEQINVFLAVANEYKLNPFTKEIYAFPTKGGGIQPIVSIDGWVNIINSHPQYDGVEFADNFDGKNIASITCKMFRKDRSHHTEATEYMIECKRDTEPWKKWPARMLRHKAMIQCARYAFGFSGIIDPDEADRYEEVGVTLDVEPSTHESNVTKLADIGKNGTNGKPDDGGTSKDDERRVAIINDIHDAFDGYNIADDQQAAYLQRHFATTRLSDLATAPTDNLTGPLAALKVDLAQNEISSADIPE